MGTGGKKPSKASAALRKLVRRKKKAAVPATGAATAAPPADPVPAPAPAADPAASPAIPPAPANTPATTGTRIPPVSRKSVFQRLFHRKKKLPKVPLPPPPAKGNLKRPVPSEPEETQGDPKRQALEGPEGPVAAEPVAKAEARESTQENTGDPAPRNRKYTFTNIESIPMAITARSVLSCTLEFLKVPVPDLAIENLMNYTNPCLIRLTFTKVTKNPSLHLPGGTRGVTIHCSPVDVEIEEGTQVPARIRVSTFTHQGAHKDAVKVVNVPIAGDENAFWTVRQFLEVLPKEELVDVAYCKMAGQKLAGGRDWT